MTDEEHVDYLREVYEQWSEYRAKIEEDTDLDFLAVHVDCVLQSCVELIERFHKRLKALE